MDIQIKSQPFTKDELKNIKEDLHCARIRRFGAIVDHQKLNYSYNALISWAKQSLSRKLTWQLKEKDYISHIYLRKAHRFWPFGLYTMVHAQTQEELNSHIQELLKLLGRCNFKVLNTLKEFKKVSFNPNENRLYISSRLRKI